MYRLYTALHIADVNETTNSALKHRKIATRGDGGDDDFTIYGASVPLNCRAPIGKLMDAYVGSITVIS